jgi:hypothetical protein
MLIKCLLPIDGGGINIPSFLRGFHSLLIKLNDILINSDPSTADHGSFLPQMYKCVIGIVV